MKKTLLKGLALAALGSFIMIGSALAGPVTSLPDPSLPGLTGNYKWSNADYWTLTDFTSGTKGNTNFTLLLEIADWESDFGLYSVDNVSSPTTVVQKFEIFDRADEPSVDPENPNEVAVYFNQIGADWYVDKNNVWGDGSDVKFDDVFGFYFTTNTTPEYTWYSDMQFNNGDGEHIAISYDDKLYKAKIYLDDQPSSDADHDWKDMVTAGDDLQPVPEPATMLLFGAGLAGLAGVSRRKKS